MDVAGRTQVVSVSSRAAFGYDAETGRKMLDSHARGLRRGRPSARLRGTWRSSTTGSMGANLFAVRVDESTRSNVHHSDAPQWNRNIKGNSAGFHATAKLDRGRVWMLTVQGVLYAIDAQNRAEHGGRTDRRSFSRLRVIVGDRLYA